MPLTKAASQGCPVAAWVNVSAELIGSTSPKHPEGQTLAFNRDLPSPEGALKTVVAFANTAGGTLPIGVHDRTRDGLAFETKPHKWWSLQGW